MTFSLHRKVWLCILICCGACLLCCGCRRGMFDNSRYRPFEQSPFDHASISRPSPPHTIARGQLEEDDLFYRGQIGTNLVQMLPVALSAQLLDRGRERFDIYCSVCHSRTGNGDGMIVERGFPRPPSFHIPRLREAPIGHFYNVITHGYGVMYSYASRVEPADRWAIAAYIRALQLSENATPADVPPNLRTQLQSQP
jgi:mono/diheme cytochrome c family protein